MVVGFLLVAVSPVCCVDGEPNFDFSTTGSEGLAVLGDPNFGFSLTIGSVGLTVFGEPNFGLELELPEIALAGGLLELDGDPNFGLEESVLDGLLIGGLLLELPEFGEPNFGLELLDGLLDGGLLLEPDGFLLELDPEDLLDEGFLDWPNPSWTNMLIVKTASNTDKNFHVLIKEPFLRGV